jgi:hypothetical protein
METYQNCICLLFDCYIAYLDNYAGKCTCTYSYNMYMLDFIGRSNGGKNTLVCWRWIHTATIVLTCACTLYVHMPHPIEMCFSTFALPLCNTQSYLHKLRPLQYIIHCLSSPTEAERMRAGRQYHYSLLCASCVSHGRSCMCTYGHAHLSVKGSLLKSLHGLYTALNSPWQR